MWTLFFLCLLSPVVLSVPRSCIDCDQSCKNKYETATLIEACMKGCRSSVGLEATTDEFGVNVNCETSCKNLANDQLRSACYDGCTYISPAKIERTVFGFFNTSIFSRILELFSPISRVVKASGADETHIRIILPGGSVDGPHMMSDDDIGIMSVMHRPDVEHPSAFRLVPTPPLGDDYSFCSRARAVLYHFGTRPLFLVATTFALIVFVCLLTFICFHIGAKSARKAASQRQYRRMPAFFKSPSMRVSLLTPQPPSSDEVPELPPKEPIL